MMQNMKEAGFIIGCLESTERRSCQKSSVSQNISIFKVTILTGVLMASPI